MSDTRIAPTAPHRTTREDRAREIVRNHAETIAASRIGATYRVPGCDGTRVYFVSLARETCECPDHEHGHTCKHLIAATIIRAKTRACAGCGDRHLGRDLVEVEEGHLTFFEGDELCRKCSRDFGVA